MRCSRRSFLQTLPAMIVLVLSTVALPMPSQAEESEATFELPLRFQSNALNLNTTARGRTSIIQIEVRRWSTDEEQQVLLEALQAGERRSLPEALSDQDSVGNIRETRSRAETLRYARMTETENGRRIILATDRPMGFVEMSRSLRTTDYNVSMVILDVDHEGNGTGQLMLGATIRWDEAAGQIAITNFATEPIRLNDVRLR